MEILVKDIISNALSEKDAKKLNTEIDTALNQNHPPVLINFSGIKFFSSLFFNESVCKYIFKLGIERYSADIQITNLSEVGEATYRRSYENAKDFYQLSPEEKALREQDLADLEEE